MFLETETLSSEVLFVTIMPDQNPNLTNSVCANLQPQLATLHGTKHGWKNI